MRRIENPETMRWRNPLKDADPRPYLTTPSWPEDPTSEAASAVFGLLENLYCGTRTNPTCGEGSIAEYIASPDEPMLVIWGGPGVGKTWLLRHELCIVAAKSKMCHGGVIDLQDKTPQQVMDSLVRQMCPIVEQYFTKFHESPFAALERYVASKRSSSGRTSTGEFGSPHETANRWMADGYTQKYLGQLLAAQEYLKGPMLFLGLDNIDKASDQSQMEMFQLCASMLARVRTRLIVPLRRTPSLFQNQFDGLRERDYREMELSPLDTIEMLRRRFEIGADGMEIADHEVTDTAIDGKSYQYSYAKLFNMMETGDALGLITKCAGGNARTCLMMMNRHLMSNQLTALRRIGSREYATASLMLEDSAEGRKADPLLLNLFDSEERGNKPGYNLLRFRVLQYLVKNPHLNTADEHFQRYFDRLGYLKRIREVIATFVGTGLATSRHHLEPDIIRAKTLDEVGDIESTDSADAYLSELIRGQWYWVCVKRLSRFPSRFISSDLKEGRKREYISDSCLIEWLEDEEQAEKARAGAWESTNGRLSDTTAINPSYIVKQVIRRKSTNL